MAIQMKTFTIGMQPRRKSRVEPWTSLTYIRIPPLNVAIHRNVRRRVLLYISTADIPDPSNGPFGPDSGFGRKNTCRIEIKAKQTTPFRYRTEAGNAIDGDTRKANICAASTKTPAVTASPKESRRLAGADRYV